MGKHVFVCFSVAEGLPGMLKALDLISSFRRSGTRKSQYILDVKK